MPHTLKVVGHGVRGDIDQTQFPSLLKVTLRSLLARGVPAATSELLNLMKDYVGESVTVGSRRYEVLVCEPHEVSGQSKKGQSFFVLVPERPGATHAHHKGTLKHLREY